MFRSLGKRVYFYGLRTFRSTLRLRSLRKNRQVVILNLHRVSPNKNPFWPELHPDVFRGLLEYLRTHFRVCRLDELENAKSDRPLAVLSFDDGYYDFVEHALPLLKEFGMSANMNIIPSCVQTGKPIWNVQLYDFLNTSTNATINSLNIPGFEEKLRDDSSRTKVLYGMRLARFLKRRPRVERLEIWKFIEPFIVESGICTRMMNSDEVRQVSEMIDIGVHSYSHESMGYESTEFFVKDLDVCRRFFAEVLTLPLKIYAFPNGSYRDDQIAYLHRNGIQHILLVDEKFAPIGTSVYPRITIYGDSVNEAAMRSLGF